MPREPIARAPTTSCNWRWKGCLTANPSIWWERTPWAWTRGPSTIAIFPQAGAARLEVLCAELQPDTQAIRRLQRKMERQRRAANPGNYDAQGRPKKRGKHGLRWHESTGYEQTRRQKAAQQRRLRAHRTSLHGRLLPHIIHVGTTIIVEKVASKDWQTVFGKSE